MENTPTSSLVTKSLYLYKQYGSDQLGSKVFMIKAFPPIARVTAENHKTGMHWKSLLNY